MTTPVPGPHVQIHLADQGVDVLVRYPVEPKRANEMDNRMLTAVRDALAAAPSVPLAPSGAPALDDAKDHAG